MSDFTTAIQLAKQFLENQYKAPFLYQLYDAFMLLAEQPDYKLDGATIQAIADGIKATEQFFLFPEIEKSNYNQQQTNNLRTALNACLQGTSDEAQFQSEIKKFATWLGTWALIGNFLYGKKWDFDPSYLSVGLDEDSVMDIYANVSPNHLSLSQVFDFRKAPVEVGFDESNPAYQLINAATDLLLGELFEEAIEAFKEVQKRLPEWTAHCYNSIGVAYFYLRRYENAITAYLQALEAGEAEERIAYNVWESAQELINNSTDRNEKMRWLFLFKEHFPNSKRELAIGNGQ